MWVKDRELVNSVWLTVDEGLSLAGLQLTVASAGWRESRLWSRGETVMGLAGRLGVVEPELLPPLSRLFDCFSLWECSRWLVVKLQLFSDTEEEDEEVVEEDEEAVPLPEELELSPGWGAILG